MKSKPTRKSSRQKEWDKVAEDNRQRCNKLTTEEREHYELEALRIIYGSNAQGTARRG